MSTRRAWAGLLLALAAAPVWAQQPTTQEREQAARQVAGSAPSPQRTNRLLKLLREDPAEKVRLIALSGLGRTRDEACLRAFASVLAEDPSPEVRGSAALSLSQSAVGALDAWARGVQPGTPPPAWLAEAVLPALFNATRSSHPRVRFASLGALRSLARSERVVPLLRRRITDPIDGPGFAAASALAEVRGLTPQLLALVERALREPESPAARRREALGVLTNVAASPDLELVLPALLGALDSDDDERVRGLAAAALIRAGRRSTPDALGVDEIAAALAKAGRRDASARVRGLALGGIGFLFVPWTRAQGPLRSDEGWDRVLPFLRPPPWLERHVVPALRAGVADPEPGVRVWALESLSTLGPFAEPILPRLELALSDDEHPDSIRQALATLVSLGRHAAPIARLVRPFLSDADLELRAQASKILTQAGLYDDAVEGALRSLLDDGDYQPFALEVLILAGGRAAWALPFLRRQLRGDPDEPEQVLRALAGLGPAARPAIPELLPLLEDEMGETAELAAQILGELREPAAVAPLRDLVSSRATPELAVQAAAALATIGTAALPALPAVRALADDAQVSLDRRARAQVARARLGELEPALAGLRKLLAGEGEHSCSDLGRVWSELPRLGAELAPLVPTLRALLGCHCAGEACRLLASLGPAAASARPELVGLLDPKHDACPAALRALGRIGPAGAAAIPRISPLLDAEQAKVRGAAAEALGRLGARAALPKLRQLLADEEEVPYVLERARAAIARLTKAPPGR